VKLGIFAKTYIRPTLGETFAAAKTHGLECVQFNFTCAGLPTLPDSISPALARQVRTELEQRSLFMAAVSGTCNLIDPDQARREKNLANLKTLLSACQEIGTKVVTLCTGTRDPSDMWRAHPANPSPEAWQDLRTSLEDLLPVAERNHVVLGVEPEPANVINSAARASKLLEEMRSQSLKIVFDAANLVDSHALDTQERTLNEAIDLLGKDIILAHAKDLAPGATSTVVAAGRGALDYDLYLSLLKKAGFNGPLILHSLQEHEVPASVRFLQQRLKSFGRQACNADALSQPPQH
jgi:sugar phosphate isomerase/epimerase